MIKTTKKQLKEVIEMLKTNENKIEELKNIIDENTKQLEELKVDALESSFEPRRFKHNVLEPRKNRISREKRSRLCSEFKDLFEKLVDETLLPILKMIGTLIALTFVVIILAVILNGIGLNFEESLTLTTKVIDKIK